MDKAQELANQIKDDPTRPDIGLLANELLREFQRGHPLDYLRDIVGSDDEQLVKIAVWIASELGAAGASLMNDIAPLVRHRSQKVRFFAIDALQAWVKPSDAPEVASVITLLNDAEASVRWKVLYFLALVSAEHLRAVSAYVRTSRPESAHIGGLEWLLTPDSTKPHGITTALDSGNDLLRKYAVIAAARLARSKHDPAPLLHAASSADTDVSQFASDMLKLARK